MTTATHDPRDGAAPTDAEPMTAEQGERLHDLLAGRVRPRHPAPPDLTAVLALAHAEGHFGVALWSHVGKAGIEYIASALNAEGAICDPRTWYGHPTPEAAIAMLATALRD